MASDTRETIYKEDCQFYRYRDGLMWGRFQTAATIEGGILYGLYVATVPGAWEKFILVCSLTIVIAILFRLARKDAVDCQSHLDRMKEYEKGVAEFKAPAWWGPHGYALTQIGMGIIILANLGLIAKFGWAAISPLCRATP